MQKHKEYWKRMTAPLLNSRFKGNIKSYNNYFQKSFEIVEPIMEKYSKQNNEFWNKAGDERAFYQTMEDTFLMPVKLYEQEITLLLGRDFKYSEISNDNPKKREENLAELRQEVALKYREKYPEKWEAFRREQKRLRAEEQENQTQTIREKEKKIEETSELVRTLKPTNNE